MSEQTTAILAEDVSPHSGADAGVVLLTEREFQEIYHQLGRPVWAYLYRMTGNAADADDLVQDTFCRLLATPVVTRDTGELRAYVFRIATNAAIDRWRRAERQPRASEPVPDSAQAPGNVGEDVARRQDVAATLRELKPQERIMLWLAYVEGSEHREIAGALGLKTSSVPVLLFRARKKLATLLRKKGLGPEAR